MSFVGVGGSPRCVKYHGLGFSCAVWVTASFECFLSLPHPPLPPNSLPVTNTDARRPAWVRNPGGGEDRRDCERGGAWDRRGGDNRLLLRLVPLQEVEAQSGFHPKGLFLVLVFGFCCVCAVCRSGWFILPPPLSSSSLIHLIPPPPLTAN